MKKILLSHRKRAEQVRSFFSRKHTVTVITVLAASAFLVHFLCSYHEQVHTEQTLKPEQTVTDHAWEFYPSDIAVLLAGSGICSLMMLREKRKAKEEVH